MLMQWEKGYVLPKGKLNQALLTFTSRCSKDCWGIKDTGQLKEHQQTLRYIWNIFHNSNVDCY